MEDLKRVRFTQRFSNLKRAFFQLSQAVERSNELFELEKEGLIHRFEYTFELIWKTLKDYLETQEVEAKFPREVVKQAFYYEIIKDGDLWMEMLEKRNLMAHTYDEERFSIVYDLIVTKYYQELKLVYEFLEEKQ